MSGIEYLNEIASQCQAGKRPWRKVTTVLAAFGYVRRRQSVIDTVNGALDESGLRTRPQLRSDTPLSQSLTFYLADEEVDGIPEDSGATQAAGEPDDDDGDELTSVLDITITVANLVASEREPDSIAPDSEVSTALTRMQWRGISHLVVKNGPKSVKGVVSFGSIARAQLQGNANYVRQCVEDVPRVPLEEPLLKVVDRFREFDAVIVLKKDKTLSGLVTPADIAEEFGGMAEPFFLVGEIESLWKWLLKRRKIGPRDFLAEAEDGFEASSDVDFLGLGDIERIVQQEDAWQRLSVRPDRKEVARALHSVRELRNQVMHFRGKLEDSEVKELRNFLELMKMMCTAVDEEPAAKG